jgi:F-type H+-transporting ATPase subunit gamma
MQRADKNIQDIQEDLKRRYQRMRQGAIDEELFDVLSGYELLRHPQLSRHP